MILLSRRGFGGALAGGAIGGIVSVRSGMACAAAGRGRPVVGFHNDAPWIDATGRDRPFRPPHAAGRFAADSTSLAWLGHFL